MPFVSLYKVGGWYYARFAEKLRLPRQSLRTKDKRLAEAERFRLEQELRFGKTKDKTLVDLRFSKLARLFLDVKQGQGIAESTLSCYHNALNNFGAYLRKDLLVRDITPSMIEDYPGARRKGTLGNVKKKRKDGQPEKHPAEKTVRNELVVVLTAFKWAERRGHIVTNPARNVELPKKCKTPPRYLRYDEYLNLQRAIDDEDFRDVIDFYVLTGIRRAEGVALRAQLHVDLERRTLTVPQSKQKDYKILPISPELMPVLKRLILKSGSEGQLIPYNEDTLTRRFGRYAKAAELPGRITFHALRHTFGTWLANRGINFSEIQSLMGHTDPESTRKYVHAYNTDLKGAISKLVLPTN